MHIIKFLTASKELLENAIRKYESVLKKAPAGSLSCHNTGDRWEYYQVRYSEKKKIQKYLKNSKAPIAVRLAEKAYAGKQLRAMRAELSAINEFLEKYDPFAKGIAARSTNPGAVLLLEPISDLDFALDKAWTEPSNQTYASYREHLRFQTKKGDLVRSKSELMIADDLMYYELLYQFEKTLHLSNGYSYAPDFTIVGRDGHIYYWEHVGGLEDPGYAADFLKKMFHYYQDGIIPGKNLILSFESRDYPLTPAIISGLIEYYLL